MFQFIFFLFFSSKYLFPFFSFRPLLQRRLLFSSDYSSYCLEHVCQMLIFGTISGALVAFMQCMLHFGMNACSSVGSLYIHIGSSSRLQVKQMACSIQTLWTINHAYFLEFEFHLSNFLRFDAFLFMLLFVFSCSQFSIDVCLPNA